MSYDPGSLVQHNCYTVGEFYREHGKMRDQVKKRHSAQSTTAEEDTAPAPALASRGRQSEKNDASRLLGGARSRETRMVLSVAAAAAAGGNGKDEEASSDLKCHIQRLLEATIEQSGLMERQITAIGQCGWNILR